MGQQVGLVSNGRDAADRIRQEGWEHELPSRAAARKAASMLEQSDRLQPLALPSRRGPDQLMRIMETLARVELTDGLDFPQLVGDTISRLPRDATVVTILSNANPAAVITLQMLHRRGFAVTAILNLYDDYDFGLAAAVLAASGITAHHLKEETSVAEICRQLRSAEEWQYQRANRKQHPRRWLRHRLCAAAAGELAQERLNVGVREGVVVVQIADRQQLGIGKSLLRLVVV